MIITEDRACLFIISDQPALEHISGLPAGDREELAGWCAGLLKHLTQVPDPRDPRGVRHSLTSLLLAAVATVLAGAQVGHGGWRVGRGRAAAGPSLPRRPP
jgi:hypothetical protein